MTHTVGTTVGTPLAQPLPYAGITPALPTAASDFVIMPPSVTEALRTADQPLPVDIPAPIDEGGAEILPVPEPVPVPVPTEPVAPAPTPAPSMPPAVPAPTTPAAPTAPTAPNYVQSSFGRALGDGLSNGIDGALQIGAWSVPILGVGGAAARSFVNQRTGGTFNFGQMFGQQSLRLGPAVVSAVAGPAVADGLSYVVPNLMPKYKQDMSTSDKRLVRVKRAVVGGASVGLGALILYLKFPNLFKPKGGFLAASNMGINAGSRAAIAGHANVGAVGRMGGGVYNNRMLLGAVGGVITLGLLNHTLGQDDKTKWLAGTAAVGAATVGGAYAMKFLTKGGLQTAKGAARSSGVAFLPESGLVTFWKPNLKWIGEFANKVGMYTAVPAGTAAYNHFDVMGAFNEVTDPRYKPPTPPTSTRPQPGNGNGSSRPRGG